VFVEQAVVTSAFVVDVFVVQAVVTSAFGIGFFRITAIVGNVFDEQMTNIAGGGQEFVGAQFRHAQKFVGAEFVGVQEFVGTEDVIGAETAGQLHLGQTAQTALFVVGHLWDFNIANVSVEAKFQTMSQTFNFDLMLTFLGDTDDRITLNVQFEFLVQLTFLVVDDDSDTIAVFRWSQNDFVCAGHDLDFLAVCVLAQFAHQDDEFRV